MMMLTHLSGLATSKDGINFTRHSDVSIISDPNSFDSGCVEDPRIVKFGSLFYVTYAFRAFPPGKYWLRQGYEHGWPRHDLPQGIDWNKTNTGIAISKDLKTFKKLGRITEHNLDNRDVILFPEIMANMSCYIALKSGLEKNMGLMFPLFG